MEYHPILSLSSSRIRTAFHFGAIAINKSTWLFVFFKELTGDGL
jgi:hypothetical protein